MAQFKVFTFRVTSTRGFSQVIRHIECAAPTVEIAHDQVYSYLQNKYSHGRHLFYPTIAPGIDTGKTHDRIGILSETGPRRMV